MQVPCPRSGLGQARKAAHRAAGAWARMPGRRGDGARASRRIRGRRRRPHIDGALPHSFAHQVGSPGAPAIIGAGRPGRPGPALRIAANPMGARVSAGRDERARPLGTPIA
ncbi:hypothetical protein CV044_15800 [Achromobacter ruhlandii]|nr:hypothetical protein CV044_15800 [Achromobacter ruhlandii]